MATLPSGLEYALLVLSLAENTQALPLLAAAVLALFLPANSRFTKFGSQFVIIYVAFLIISSSLSSAREGVDVKFFSLFCYFMPVLAAKWASYIDTEEDLARLYYGGIFALLVSQGLVVLLQTQIPFLQSFSYLSSGEEHRESFGAYRFGSTVAAANTSGCLLALALPATIKRITSLRLRYFAYGVCALALLGYQSRSGFLIFSLIVCCGLIKKITWRSVVMLAIIGMLGTLLLAFRESDELASSSDYRAFLALQALSIFLDGGLKEILLGYGPGSGVSRDLASHYGQENQAFVQLLTSSESFLLLLPVEIGIIGMCIFLYVIRQLSGSLPLFLALLIYLLLDPSFNRAFESFLAVTLVVGAGSTFSRRSRFGSVSSKPTSQSFIAVVPYAELGDRSLGS